MLALPTTYVARAQRRRAGRVLGAGAGHRGRGPGILRNGFAAVVGSLGGPRYTSLVPIQLQRLLDSVPGLDALRTFDRILLGGQAPDPALLVRARQEGVVVTLTYGATETCGGVLWDGRPIGDAAFSVIDGVVHLTGLLARRRLRSTTPSGRPRPSRSSTASAGTERGTTARSAATVSPSSGASTNVIVSGGVKVSLTEVEFAARRAGLADAVVVAVDREGWGQAPAIATTQNADEQTIREAIGAMLGAAARPIAVVDGARDPAAQLRQAGPRGPARAPRLPVIARVRRVRRAGPGGFGRIRECVGFPGGEVDEAQVRPAGR